MRAEEALAECQRRSQESEAKLKDSYENRMAELHRENAALRSKIDRLEATGRARIGGQSYRESGGGVKEVGSEELSVLRRGLSEQEVLIRGYQQVRGVWGKGGRGMKGVGKEGRRVPTGERGVGNRRKRVVSGMKGVGKGEEDTSR